MRNVTVGQLSIRFDEETLRGIDTELERLRTRNPGLSLTRTDAVRSLVAAGLAERKIFHGQERKREGI